MNELRADPTTGIVSQVLANGALKPLFASLAAATLAATPLQTADTAAAAAGIPLCIDAPYALTANYTATAPRIMFCGLGQITLGGFNFVAPEDFNASKYFRCFVQTGSGQATIAGFPTDVSPCWWGADPGGNTTTELLTRKAIQAALVAGATGTHVRFPAGNFVHDASVPLIYPSNTTVVGAGRGQTFIQPDLSTVTAFTNRNFPLISACVIGAGNPVTGNRAAQPYAVSPPEFLISGQDGVGSLDPATFVWNCHFRDFTIQPLDLAAFLNTNLGNNVFLSGLQLTGCRDCTVERVDTIGLPNDGITSFYTDAKIRRCRAWLNGFSGGSAGQSTTRNGITNLGWMDITVPVLTTRGAEVIDCDTRYNHDEGISLGIGEGVRGLGNIIYGNGKCAIEGNSLQATSLTQWKKGWPVVVATSACYANGNVYICAVSGTTAAAGSGPSGNGSGIADGTAEWNYAGLMDPTGQMPSSAIIDNNDCDGIIPPSCEINGTTYTIPAGYGNGRGYAGIQWDTGNETSLVLGGGNLIRNVGVTSDTDGFCGLAASCANGGHFNIGNVLIENCTPGTGHQIFLGVSTGGAGQSANDTGKVHGGAPTILNPGSNGDALIIDGYPGDVAIGALRADAGCVYGISILAKGGSVNSLVMNGVTIEGCQASPIYLSTTAAAAIGTFSLKNCRGFNCNSAGGANDAFLRTDGAAGTTIAEFVMTGCEASYATPGIGWPLGGTGLPTGAIANAYCMNNNLNMGANNLLTMGGGATRLFPSSADVSGQLIFDDCGLPGQIVNSVGANAAPTSGSWSNGDRSKVRGGTGGTFASGTAMEFVCTASGTFGTLNGGATTGATDGATRKVVVNSATGLAVRQWIHIAGVTNGPFMVTDINGLNIGLSAVPNAAVVAAAVSFNAPVFAGLTLN